MSASDIGIDLGTDSVLVYIRGTGIVPVSYTHLDVYKRQNLYRPIYRMPVTAARKISAMASAINMPMIMKIIG